MRGLFLALIGLLVLAYLVTVARIGLDARRDARTELLYIKSTLVQTTRTALKNYELVLHGLGSELVALGALQSPARGRALIERMASIDSGMAGFGLARPDGQLVLVSGIADGTLLPNLMQQPETRGSFAASLRSGHLQVGRPYYMKALGQWVIPVRVPIADAAGKTVAVMTAGYPVEGRMTPWARAMLPPDVEMALLRDDNHLQYLYPLPAGPRQSVFRAAYGQPVHNRTIAQLSAVRQGSGIMTIDFPRHNGLHYLAYERIGEYGLLAGAFIPWRAIVLDWLQRLVGPTLLLLAFIGGGTWAYRRAQARQLESDAAVTHLTAWQQAVLDGADYSIISTDPAGTIVSFNAAAQRMLGYTPEEVIGKATPLLIHAPEEVAQHATALSREFGEAVEPGFEAFVAKARRGGSEEREWTYVRKDGSRFPVRLSVTPLYGADGTLEGFLGIAADLSERRQAQADLRDSEARYRTLFERAGDSIFLMQDDRFVDCNPATLAMFGCTRDEIIGATPYRYSPEYQPDGTPSREKTLQKIAAAFRGETQFFEWRHRRHDGTLFDAEVTLSVVMLGEQAHLLATVRDISQRKQVAADLEQSRQALVERNENLRLINQLSNRLHASLDLDAILKETMDALRGLSHAPNIAIYLLTPDGARLNLVASSGFGERLRQLGATLPLEGSLSGLAITGGQALVSEDFAADDRLQPEVRDALVATGLRAGVVIPMVYHERPLGSLNLVYGERRSFGEVELETLRAFSNTVALAIANSRHLVRLAFQARHDSLTALPNRSVLHEEFAERVARSAGRHTALLLLDLNRFKEINDTLGHHVGDHLLTHIGPRLVEALSDRDALICRLGGDEFAVLLGGLAARDDAVAVARRLADALHRPFPVDDMALQLGASVGVAYYPEHGANSHALLRAADVAMYQAKRLTTEVVVYDPGFDGYSPDRLALAGELVQAVQQGELVLHYQPKLDLASGRITGFEALVRWQNPRLGLLYPAAFVHLVEMNEVIHPFTRAVMDQALADKRRLHELGYTQPVAINLSARNLLDAQFVSKLSEVVARHGVSLQEVELELTETALMHDPDAAVALLQAIAAMGVAIAVDDFGTGYSSLAYLRRLPISALKIDRSFVGGMSENAQDAIIVRSTIALAHSLGLRVIAEGVETAATQAMLDDMGCDQIQGFHFSRPLPLDALLGWLDARAGQTSAPQDSSAV
jgi:diguanylate cyclase (GGDEF)-like protein/PAS domain S-box-containing protein